MLQFGVLVLLAAMVGGIGLPAFIIHPVSIWSYIAARRAAHNPDSSGASDTALERTVVTSNASTLVCGCASLHHVQHTALLVKLSTMTA
jgi:hypothetical protein